jgi:hypothetical protein
MEEAGKSGGEVASLSLAVGPSSDQPRRAFRAWPLKRWKVSMPMPGFTSTSSMGFGRTITVSCAAAGEANTQKERTQISLRIMMRPHFTEKEFQLANFKFENI